MLVARAVARRNFDIAAFAERRFVLADLITLGQVGIEVALAVEDRARRDLAVRRKSGPNRQFDDAPVEHRQHARHPHAHRADVFVGPRAEVCRASAEQLRAWSADGCGLRVRLPLRMHRDSSSMSNRPCIRAAGRLSVNRARALEGVAGAQDRFLAERRADYLHPDRQVVRVVAARNRQARAARQGSPRS